MARTGPAVLTMMDDQEIPADYERFTLEEVVDHGDTITLRYAGRCFGGVLREWVSNALVRAALRPGAEIAVRCMRAPGGTRGQIDHVILRVAQDRWAEIYLDTDGGEV